jgi:hypothetical protein
MDQHYNWGDSTFENRCGESLNLAVNLVADVLHKFYSDVIVPEFPSIPVLVLLMFSTLAIAIVCRKSLINRDGSKSILFSS